MKQQNQRKKIKFKDQKQIIYKYLIGRQIERIFKSNIPKSYLVLKDRFRNQQETPFSLNFKAKSQDQYKIQQQYNIAAGREISIQRVMGARRISIKTQISSNSTAQQNQVHTPKSKENSQIQLNKQISINNNNTIMEGVVTESDSCLNMMSNNQFVINSRHAAFMQDDCLSNPSSQNTIGQIGNTINILNQQYKSENLAGNHFQQGSFQYNTNDFNNQMQFSSIQQQNTQYINAFKDKRLTPTMRRANENNSFNYENNFFNQQKWKNNILKQGGIVGNDDHRGGDNDPYSYRNTVREFQAMEMNRHRIDLQQMQLQRLPTLVLEMKSSLQELNLSYNNFIIFPQELCQFLHLKVMKLDFNYFSELPEQIAFLKYLEELSISHNCLKELPGTLQNMSNLRILNVGQNNISHIGQEVTNIKKLEVLYIYNNEFTVLPAKLRNLIHLKEFGLDWFRYTKPPIDTLLSRPDQNSLFSKLFDLCGQHAINAKPTISFKDFVKHFSKFAADTDFSKVDGRGRTVAFLATESEELGVLKALFEENKDILNQQDREGQTLLTQALIDNKVRSIKFLLDNGADPSKGSTHLGNTLHLATSKLNQELVLKFLLLGVNPNAVDFEGSTPLHVAFSIFQKDSLAAKVISEQLLSNGADPNISNQEGWTPLHIAVRKNQKDAVKYALEYNEKVKKLNAISPSNSQQNVMNNASGLSFNNDDDQSGFYPQDQRDSQKRLHSYKIKNDSIDEIQYYTASTPQRSYVHNFDKSNQGTPKIESENTILHNRSSFANQDSSAIYTKNYKGNKLNHQEEDLTDDNEDRSPGQTHRTAHFNNQQQMKISKNCKKSFKFDKKGGSNEWSVMHLAANQGNINMLELLSEANSCPFSLTRLSQIPRKVALQSLILFKILRKYEDRWMLKNVLGEEYQSEFQQNNNVVERHIQNLRGFIAETMKRKEHFLHEQLDLFDDKEFGYSIKENLQNNQAQNPRNKDNDNESDEDEVLDPELSFEKAATSFKFNGMLASQGNQMMETISAGSSLIIPPNNGTLKPQQFGSILRQNSKGQNGQKYNQKDDNNILLKTLGNKKQNADEDYEDDDELMNDIDECDDDNDSKFDADDFDEDVNKNKNCKSVNGAARNIAKANSNADDRSCVFMRNLPNANVIPSTNSNSANPLMSMMLNFSEFRVMDQKMNSGNGVDDLLERMRKIKIKENTLTSYFFTDISSLESDKFGQEVEKLKNHFLYESTIFQETLNVLQLLQIIHIRLSQKNMKFVSDRGTLPRNIHIMNEFLHSKMDQQAILSQKEILPSLLASFLHDLLDRIQPLPEIDPDQGTTYFQFNKIAKVNRANQNINLLILRTRDVLCNLNCLDFFSDFFQKCLETYNISTQNSKKDHIIAFSTCDYSNTTFLDYENMQNQCFINATKPATRSMNNSYQIIGSPSYYYQQKQQIISRSSRKSQSQTASEMIKLTQQNINLQKNQKGMIQNQNNILSRPPANPKGSQIQSQKQNIQNLNLPQPANKSFHSSTSIENNNSRLSSNNSRNSQNYTADTHNKNAHSFIQESTFNQKQYFTESSNNSKSYQMKLQTESNTNYRGFPKSSNDVISQINQVAAPQFIQLSSRIDEPKMPNELKKIDLNTFGVNLPQQQNQSQYQSYTSSSQTKNYSQNQISQNQQPPGPKNIKNNNTPLITKPSTEEIQLGIQSNTYKSVQGKSIESSTTTTSGLYQSQGHQKLSTAPSIDSQDIIHYQGQKNQFQQFNQLHQDSKQKQLINFSNHKPQVNQSHQYEVNHNKINNDFNKSYVYIPSTQPSQNQQYHSSKQYMSNSNKHENQQNLQNNQNIYSTESYTNSVVKHAKSEANTPQNYSTNASSKHSKEQSSFTDKFRKNQKNNFSKNDEENISDEDFSDESSKQRTQEASKKQSDYKMQFSPFSQKI